MKELIMKRIFLILLVFFTLHSKLIKIAATEWEPYTSEKLLNNGFLTEIATEALEAVGYISEVEFVPWKRAVEFTKKGTYDALLGASYTDERTKYFSYPNELWVTNISIFALAGKKDKYVKIKDLCPGTIGILNGSLYTDTFRKVECLKVETANGVLNNIKKLLVGRVDYVIDSRESINFLLGSHLKSYEKGAIEEMHPVFDKDSLYMVFSKVNKNVKKYTSDFNKGLKIIKQNGVFEKVLRKHSQL